jgi:hypothetical protein
VAGAAQCILSAKYGVSRHSLGRHLKNHIPAERSAALLAGPVKINELADRATESGLSLMDYLQAMVSALFESFLQCRAVNDHVSTGLLASRLTEVLRLQAQVTGEVSKATTTINNQIAFVTSPQYEELKRALAEALLPYPEALAAVATRLERLAAPAMPASASAVPAVPVALLEGPTHGAA